MGDRNFPVRAFQTITQFKYLLLGIGQQTFFFRRGLRRGIRNLCEVDILRRNLPSSGCFQEIQTLMYCNFAEPCFFVLAIEVNQIFVGGQEYLLGEVFRIKGVAY